MSSKYFYVFIRVDIPIQDQMCQVAHAAALAGKQYHIPNACNLVLCQVPDEAALNKIADTLAEKKIHFSEHHEPDDNMGFTCLATQAIEGEKRKPLMWYPLWKPVKLAG